MVVFLNTLFLTQLFQSPFFGFFGTANIDFFRFFCTFCQQKDTVVGNLDETAANITDMPSIDSKFPGDTYAHLQDAQASGDAQAVENARHALELVLRSEAKDIREKYVEPPYTTTFGILFLPFEGLYAEVVNAGLLEVLQRDYQVNIAGPSTMAALLNSLQMGFKTLAIQKRSGEVWQLLGAVKTEFDKFGQGLSKMQQRLRQTDEELDNLIGVRSRAISRKLRSVQSLDDASAAALLELDNEPGRPVAARLPEELE